MKWVLLLVVILLFLWSIRETFDNYADALNDVGQSTGYTDTSNPDAPHTGVGTAGTVTPPADTSTPAPADTSSSAPASTPSPPADTSTPSPPADTSTPSPLPLVTGPAGTNTTGGSSMAPQTTSGDKKDNKVWGPAYVGMGDNSGLDGLGGPREYPVLLGPKPKESTMVEGAGVFNQSNSSNKAGLPSAQNTGSDENSMYFGTSRMPGGAGGAGGGASRAPGDKDLVQNPYQEFTPSIGSYKTEPVPFLSDFSAFQK